MLSCLHVNHTMADKAPTCESLVSGPGHPHYLLLRNRHAVVWFGPAKRSCRHMSGCSVAWMSITRWPIWLRYDNCQFQGHDIQTTPHRTITMLSLPSPEPSKAVAMCFMRSGSVCQSREAQNWIEHQIRPSAITRLDTLPPKQFTCWQWLRLH